MGYKSDCGQEEEIVFDKRERMEGFYERGGVLRGKDGLPKNKPKP